MKEPKPADKPNGNQQNEMLPSIAFVIGIAWLVLKSR
jgi:hypothetical protein